MSDRACSSCGTVNTGSKVYCSGCGGILQKSTSSAEGAEPASATTAVAQRRSVRIEADRPAPPTLFSRIKGVVRYLLLVALGVVVVLALMEPNERAPETQDIPNARSVIQRMMASARFSPGVLSQQLLNSCLAQQGSSTWESPVRLVPMPTWESFRVEIEAGKITVFAVLSVMGRPLHLSETFRPEGLSGEWRLVPASASIGLLKLPRQLLPGITPLIRAGMSPFDTELASLATSRNLVMRPGMIEFTAR